MPKYPDAIGYINELSKEVNEPWFEMLCDLVTTGSVSTLDKSTIIKLCDLYLGTEKYIRPGQVPATTAIAIPTTQADRLEQLSGFRNFKRLGDALEINFKKRITLIFGANASGKSSLCESLKALSTPEQPSRPLENVRAESSVTPEFRYKFKSDPYQQTWSPAIGYGSRQAAIKYFDTAIAIGNVRNEVEPGRVITLTPFKLYVFDLLKTLTSQFRGAIVDAQQGNLAEMRQALNEIRLSFAEFHGRPLSLIDESTTKIFAEEIKLGEEFKDQVLLNEKQAAAEALLRATSEEGLKLLKAERHELESLLTSLNAILNSAAELWKLEPAKKASFLAEKQRDQESLAKSLIPQDGTLDAMLILLRAASPLCQMDDGTGQVCPLCRRDLGIPEVELFKRYHNLLSDELESSIGSLKKDIGNAFFLASAIQSVDRLAWDRYETIDAGILANAKRGSAIIVANCDTSKEPTEEARAELESLKVLTTTWGMHLDSKMRAIDIATKGRSELVNELEKLQSEIEPLKYSQGVANSLDKLRKAQEKINIENLWNSKLPTFPPLLKKITDKAKKAYEGLVVTNFENRLNDEYKALAEKNMAAFGVQLVRKGVEAAVTVVPLVGGMGIEGVLSEGELRVHALALFFAELETCAHPILVFDDPISSFDYNYIANYCIRLREFTRKHPTRQIIVLTHNWEFFVQLQTTLNQAGFDSLLSVQVLENCAVVAEYSEKIDILKKEICDLLNISGELTNVQKEDISGKMRRLIEAVVNTHVFYNQRHQFKQKSQQISAFGDFTKVTALLSEEAVILGDLYAKLSPPEHDDPRNLFVNTDKAMFQTRYESILNIEAAIRRRKP